MRPVSPAFLRAVRGSHRMVARATIVDGHQTGVSPVGTVIPIEGGDVTTDASAAIRATLDLSTTADYWPRYPSSLVTPYGPEVFIERGLVLGGGQEVYVSQGYYRLYGVEQDAAPKGAVRLSGRDRMSGLIDERLEAPAQFMTSASVAEVFDALVRGVYPDAEIEFDFDAESTTFPGSHICERERHPFLDAIVRALGKVWHWDYRGVLVVRDAPSPTAPIWDITHGRSGVLVRAGRERTREGVYNAVVVLGEAVGDRPPVRAVARDMTPTSPVRWGGPFGRVPRFMTSQFVTTSGQAANAAAAALTRTRGLPYSVSFESVVNPALETLDPIRVSYSDRERVEVHTIQQLRMPLVPEQAMTGTTRDQTGIAVEVEA